MSQQRPPNMFNTTTINSTGNVIQLLREFLRKNSSVLGSINSDCYNTLMTSMRMMLEETIPHINNLMSEYYGEKLELETRDETQDKIWQIVTAGVNVDELVLIIAALHGTKMGKTLDDVYISQAKIHASSRIAEVRHSYTGDSINSPELWKTATMKQLGMYEKGSDFEITRKSPTIFEQRKSIRSRHARSEDVNLPPIYPKGRSLSEGLLFMRTKYVPKDPNSTTQSKV
ncbi:hypothetical protein PRIPAC_96812 [Pristionchus pacificus]|uniref:Uncharacterized protein n=1 Tax=Pristionchus pacificus TaxID=54126 RepID=A0A2A6B2E1_PRIPA|nr:hypothetical protein PRIPAC_96812 [Pristionchus pacificus]|eukprot:PDM60048.1 hypothetical protein PRIPAC_49334 [Pristionchus pacificus]